MAKSFPRRHGMVVLGAICVSLIMGVPGCNKGPARPKTYPVRGVVTLNGTPVEDDRKYTICLSTYHEKGAAQFLSVSAEEMRATGPSKTVATSIRDVLEEFLRNHQNLDAHVEGRLVYV